MPIYRQNEKKKKLKLFINEKGTICPEKKNMHFK